MKSVRCIEGIMLTPRFESFNHFVFDLDGTLINSLPVMSRAWEKVNEETGIDIPFIKYKQFVGLPFDKILDALKITEGRSEIRKLYFSTTSKLITEITVFDGASRLLNWLGAQGGINVSIITSKPHRNAEAVLQKLDLPYDILIGGDELPFGKPHADPFLQAESVLGLSSSNRCNTIYFGDTLSDLVFALNSGIYSCHCDYGFYGPLPVRIRNKLITVNSLNEVLA